MTSYQVMCSVLRPPDPTSQCQIAEFQEKVPQHLDSVFQVLTLAQGKDGGNSHLHQGQRSQGEDGGGGDGPISKVQPSTDANLMLCAVVSKTSASFSGADSLKSRVRLPFFWCNWCPFDTESKASLLQHIVSQHCFVCRFCPFVALSRLEVICHGLDAHHQFSQYQEQKLKACHLKRDLFQLHFDPKSDGAHSRKRTAFPDNNPDEGPSSPKCCRGDPYDSITPAEPGRLQNEESSSDSVDDLPLQFQKGKYMERRSSSSQGSASQDAVNVTTHVMENVVSSSGMEADVGGDQTLTSRIGHPDTCLSPKGKEGGEQMILAIKHERESDDADFTHALGGNAVEVPGQGGGLWKRDGSAASGVHIKQEPVDASESPSSLHQVDGHQDHILSRSVSSPPLSSIRVENLQRQFEESFGVHPVAVTSMEHSEFQHSEPHPVQLIAQPSRTESQGLVENFLIDPSKSTPVFSPGYSDDRSSPSMLRHLLTRPLHTSSGQSSVLRDDSIPVEQEGSLLDESERQYGQMQESVAGLASATKLQDNFLLTSDKRQMLENDENVQSVDPGVLKTLKSSNTENQIHSQTNTASSENMSIFVKQEPEYNAEDYSAALNLMDGAAAEQDSPTFQDALPDPELKDAPSMVCSGSHGHQEALHSSPSSSRVPEGSWESCPSEKVHRQNLSLHSVLSAEKLKSYSNMSLRDLLTMDTKECASSAEGQDGMLDGSARERDGASTMQGDVVWECGFCHFEDSNKAVVLAHRRQQHSQQVEEIDQPGSAQKEGQVSWPVSLVDEDGKSHGEVEEVDDQVSWVDQMSTSTGYRSISQHLASYPPSTSSELDTLMYARTQRARGIRRDDDFEYLSESTLESESDPEEPDNLQDKTYEPPKNLVFEGTVLSSEEEREEDFVKKTRNRKAAGDKVGKRKCLDKKKHMRKDPNRQKDPDLQEDPAPEDVAEEIKEPKQLYRCISCRRQPLTLLAMKDHIRYAPDNRHLLMIRPVAQSACLHFICPGTTCLGVKSALFTECQSYLVHVLQCQGHIFDVLRSTMQMSALSLSSKIKEWAGFLNCPISYCHFVSYHEAQLRAHLDEHLEHLHTSQMLLFRSVCTVMAKMFGGVDGFDRYICYRCSSILIDLPRVIQHMMSDHGGQVRGVLLVTQKTESRSQGIVVAIQCLKCSLRVPSLYKWFTHECQSTPSPSTSKGATSTHCREISAYDCNTVGVYNPEPSVPPFQEWVWGQQSSSTKTSPSAPLASSSQKEAAFGEQLPLIRSILLSHPQRKKREAKTLDSSSELKDRKDLEEDEEEEVTAMVQCEVCQQFVPENSYNQHSCFHSEQKMLQNREKDSDVHEGSFSDTAASQQHLPQQQPGSLRADSNISHSKLLAALATRHHSNPLLAQSQNTLPSSVSTPKLPLSTTTHPSLVSLLTQTEKTSLNQSPRPLPCQAANPQRTGNLLMDHLSKFQMRQAANPLPVHEKSLQTSPKPVPAHRAISSIVHSPNPVSVNEKSSQKSLEPAHAHKTIRSILSDVLKRKSENSQQVPHSRIIPETQDQAEGKEASEGQSNRTPNVSTAVSLRPVKEEYDARQPGQQQQPESRTVAKPSAERNVPAVEKEGEALQSSTKSAHPPLMNFLRQQGDHVRQVLGKILDDQEECLQS